MERDKAYAVLYVVVPHTAVFISIFDNMLGNQQCLSIGESDIDREWLEDHIADPCAEEEPKVIGGRKRLHLSTA